MEESKTSTLTRINRKRISDKMIKNIDLSRSKQYELPILNEEQAKKTSSSDKGWSYSYVYHFIELKNVFIALKKIHFLSKDDFSKKAIKSGLPFVKTPWDGRRILEQLNALVNFDLVTKTSFQIQNDVFSENDYVNELNESDLKLFKDIYHNYFRFKEIHTWLLNPFQQNHDTFISELTITNLEQRSLPIFPFLMENRFNDAFLYSLTDNTDIFRISGNNGDLMRFWDVYVKWGQELELLEKFNLKDFEYRFQANYKALCCVYYKKPGKPNINLHEFIRSEYKGRHINVLNLVFKIALKYRYSIDSIKTFIIDSAIQNSSVFSLQRTSEIFLNGKEIAILPKFGGSYISHLLI